MRFYTLKSQLLAMFLFFSLVLNLISAFTLFSLGHYHAKTEMELISKQTNRQITDFFQKKISGMQNNIKKMTTSEEFIRNPVQTVSHFIRYNDLFFNCYVFNPDGAISEAIYSDGRDTSLYMKIHKTTMPQEFQEAFEKTLGTKQMTISQSFVTTASHVLMVWLYPILDSTKTISSILSFSIHVNDSKLQEMLDQISP